MKQRFHGRRRVAGAIKVAVKRCQRRRRAEPRVEIVVKLRRRSAVCDSLLVVLLADLLVVGAMV